MNNQKETIMTNKKLSIALVLTLLLMGAGCPSNRVATYMNIVAEGASSIVSALAAAGVVDPAVAAKVTGYAKQASQLILDINAELKSTTDNKAQQWTKISAEIGQLLAQDIPGVPPKVGIAIAAVNSALLILEAALADQLGQTVPTKDAAKRATVRPSDVQPHGRTMEDAVKTATATLATIAAVH